MKLQLASHMKRTNSKFGVKLVLTKARVPILSAVHCKSKKKVEMTFMCPAVRRDCAIRNTRLLRTYAENVTQFRKGVNFLKLLIGHTSSFSAKTQGISSYGWAVLFAQYCIASRKSAFNSFWYTDRILSPSYTTGPPLPRCGHHEDKTSSCKGIFSSTKDPRSI